MDLGAAREFLCAQHRAVLATMRSDGMPQLSPVVAAVDDADRALISTRETAMKTKNLARDPRASLCVFSDAFFGPWIQVDGVAEIISLPDAMDLLIDYYRRVSGEHPDWDEYRSAMRDERRVAVAITLTRAGPDRSG